MCNQKKPSINKSQKYVETLYDTDVSDSQDDQLDDSGDETDDYDDEPFNEDTIDEISNVIEKTLVVSETETST